MGEKRILFKKLIFWIYSTFKFLDKKVLNTKYNLLELFDPNMIQN